jgi:hypothetical protein
MNLNPYLKSANKKYVDRKTGEPFNPFATGRKLKSGGIETSASQRMFNSDGVLNADSKEDALGKIQTILDGMATGSYDIERVASYENSYSPDEKEALLREAFADPGSEGFRQVGQNLLNPVKEVLDYEGLSRKFLMQRTIKQGETFRVDKDVYVVGWTIAEDGQTPQSVVPGAYFFPPEFEVTAYPSIELKDKYRAQYDILGRAQDRARMAIEYQEDLAFVNLAQVSSGQVNTATAFATLNLAALESMRYQIERHRLLCQLFLIHRQEVSDLVNTVSTQVDPVTQREAIMAGFIASILNAYIVTTAGTNTFEILQPGEAYALTDPEHLGVMGTRVELFSEPVNEYMLGNPRQGWFWYELISQSIHNPAGVAYGQKTS